VDRRPHFHLAGIPVRVEPWFFVIIAVLGFTYQDPPLIGTWVGLAFVSVLLHEVGHAVAFRLYGARPAIVLHGMGGLTSARIDLTPGRSIAVSLAGPLAALVLLGLPALWLESSGIVTGAVAATVVSQAVWINVGWSLLNLIPVLPLDGGNVAASLFEMVFRGRGRQIAAGLSLALLGGLALWGFSIGAVFLLIVVVLLAGPSIAELRAGASRRRHGSLQQAWAALMANEPWEAEATARRLLSARPDPDTARAATEVLGWARLFQGDAGFAAAEVDRQGSDASPAYRAALALAAGRQHEGVAVATWTLAHEQRPEQRALAALAVAWSGVVAPVVDELLLVDALTGPAAAWSLHELYQGLGLHGQAQVVAARLAARNTG
jgi:Zn-dependent protease